MAEARAHLPHRAWIAAAVAIAALAPLGCKQITKPGSPASKPTTTRQDEDYIGALAAANELCEAWQRARYSSVIKDLFSKRMREAHSDDALYAAITGPHHAAYEISEGRLLNDGRYAFKLLLFLVYPGQMGNRIEKLPEEIVMARDTSGRWKVDEFPVPREPGGP